ncbi:serine protease 53-like [Seriola lalandi dorsalis]|nr:serine protease 53-like [Seriola lalandi dorsalis]
MHGLHKFLLFQVVACLGQGARGSEIIDGEKAPENSMLYMASLQSKGGHVCGGFLISEDFVMTAAHCQVPDNLTRVVLGTHNIKNVDEGKIRYIEKMYKHESYQNVGTGKDIMLLKLSRKAELNNKLQTIPLPRSEIHLGDNTKCYVAGWGFIKTGGGVVNELRVVDVSVINPRVCREMWGGVPDNVICAGGYKTKKGFCQGDSGGPLVCDGTAVGIVSFNWEKNCNYPDKPNVYTDVSKYLPWIKTILKRTKRSDGSKYSDQDTMVVNFVLVLFFVLTGADGTHIVGGRDAAPHSRPYMASLQVRGAHNCGGVLVREDFVLTAAHCNKPRTDRVVLGADSLSRNETTKQKFTVARSIPHPNYNGHANDIMLLKLDRRAKLTEAVQLISLKRGSVKKSSQCITSGWGDIGDNKTLANRLQEVNVTILSGRTCRRRWGEVPIAKSMICGVGAKVFQGFCSGDSGGPLVCDGALAGVVSFSGERCGNPKTPDVYTCVSTFRKWIKKVIENN